MFPVFLAQGSTELDMVLQIYPLQGKIEGEDSSSWAAGQTVFNAQLWHNWQVDVQPLPEQQGSSHRTVYWEDRDHHFEHPSLPPALP